MIISDIHKFVYYGPPRCASTTMHILLEKPEWSGFSSWRDGQQHLVVPIPGDYLKFSVVRNPFTRAVSMWQFIYYNDGICPTFREYLQLCVSEWEKHGKDTKYIFAAWPISEWLSSVNLDFILKMEELPWCLQKIPCFQNKILNVPKMNSIEYKNYIEYYGDYERDLVVDHFKLDFEQFGYKKELS